MAGITVSSMLALVTLPTVGGLLMVGLMAGVIFGTVYGASEPGKLAGKFGENFIYEKMSRKKQASQSN